MGMAIVFLTPVRAALVTKIVGFAALDPYLAAITELISFSSTALLGGQCTASVCLPPMFAMAQYSRFGRWSDTQSWSS